MYDAIVVGGGAAGLSAALMLGRARREVLVLDAGGQSNRASGAVHGLLGHDGRPPEALYALGRLELEGYPTVTIEDERARTVTRRDDGTFSVDGREARHVVLATGRAYRLPDLPGARELFGGDVFHCPFCHGYEHRDRRLAVIAVGEVAGHMTSLLRGWSDDVVAIPDAVEIEHDGGRMRAVLRADGTRVERDAAFVHCPLDPRDDLPEQLGVTRRASGAVEVDGSGRTDVPGVWAAGDLAVDPPSITAAVHSGALAGARLAIEVLTGMRV